MSTDREEAYANLEFEDANISWQPIYVSMVLTSVQCVFLLIVFECARRNKFVESVYDRRRGVYEKRMPPPLRKRSGCLNGWLAFEWWKFRVADKEYRQLSIEEYNIEKERRRKENINKSTDEQRRNDDLLTKAERQCYLKSPFYNRCEEEDDDLSAMEMDERDDRSFSPEGEVLQEGKMNITEETFQLDALKNVSMTHDETDSNSKEMENPSETPMCLKQSLNLESEMCEYESGVPAKGKMQQTARQSTSSLTSFRKSSVTKPSLRRNISLSSIAKSDSPSPKGGIVRRIASSLRSPRSQAGDITVGSEEAERLARLRFSEPEESENARKRNLLSISSTISKFVRTRILLIQDKPAQRGPSEDYVVHHDVARRSLTEEDQEVLRCVGLDAFMTLRFLLFGFHVSFWPMCLALPLLLPTYMTANGPAINGFYSTTIIAVEKGSWRFWIVMLLLCLQFLFILRRIWTEWELFLPLRYDFLEHGDFTKEKYKEQYRETAIVEYVPSSQRHDKYLYSFFDTVFPGQIKHAEVLLNIEHLRNLRRERLEHIVAYENIYAKMVHKRADFLRRLVHSFEKEGSANRCCLATRRPREPKEPTVVIQRHLRGKIPLDASENFPVTCPALTYHHDMIQKLNNEIDTEYIRLAQEQRRAIPKTKKSSLTKRLGLTHLITSETGHVHSSTAFVEFRSLAAKQHAIQCNIAGTKKCMVVSPVPEVRDLIWGNEHVSRSLIVTRMMWINVLLAGCLVLWSLLVSLIRSYDKYSDWFEGDLAQTPTAVALLNVYLPALVVEGLVRIIPFFIKLLCKWIRFKSASETDHYILRWYFAYRLFTFIFVIEGDHLIDQSDKLIDDPVGFLLELSRKVAANSQFFICYVIITVTLLLVRLSQIHNVVEFFYLHNIVREEALSQRRLDKLRTNLKIFHKDEFIPLFIFVFMVGALYGVIAPLSGVFVSGFFLVAYKVVRFMSLFIYGNNYEGGGFLFYTLSTILFCVLYLIIIVLACYLFSHQSEAAAGIFLSLLIVTFFVHYRVHLTFVEPSKTLSLAKAREFEQKHDNRSPHQRKLEAFLASKLALDEEEERLDAGAVEDHEEHLHLLLSPSDASSAEFSVRAVMPSDEVGLPDSERLNKAIDRFQRRYEENNDDCLSEITDSDVDLSGPPSDFFIYRQPSLNRATWEVSPRPYRESGLREASMKW